MSVIWFRAFFSLGDGGYLTFSSTPDKYRNHYPESQQQAQVSLVTQIEVLTQDCESQQQALVTQI